MVGRPLTDVRQLRREPIDRFFTSRLFETARLSDLALKLSYSLIALAKFLPKLPLPGLALPFHV